VADTSGTTTYGYDGLYRLTGVTYPNSDTQSYTYDAMGNRLTKVDNSVTTTYTYDDAGQMTDVDSSSYTYDDDGNTTTAGSDTYTWDAENRLAGTTIGGVTTTYGYNGAGLRTSQTTGGVTVDYAWDLTGSLPNILQDSAGNNYVYGLDLISKTNGTTQEYYLTDGLGSTTGITDGSGTVTGTYEYDVFGAVRAQTGATTEWSYTGEQHDATGLEYLRARYYDASTGRFLSQDPMPLLQRYAYVGDNPANLVDPSGNVPQIIKDAAALVVGAAVGGPVGLAATAAAILADDCWKTHMFCPHPALVWKSAKAVAKYTVLTAADLAYAPFYFGYYGARIIGSSPPPIRGMIIASMPWLLPTLWAAEGVGLGLDQGVDRFKTRALGTDTTRDDQVCNFAMGSTIGGAINSWTGFGPKAWFPGRGQKGTDFAWGFNERKLDFPGDCFQPY
jgi:RHS repeat-associated protein